MPHEAMNPTFDIIDDPWLDVVRTDGTVATVSLRQLLTTAHEISHLSEPSPLTEVALLRFLIALVSDGLREQIPSEEEWAPFVERCRGGFPDDVIDAILAPAAGRSNVLDSEHDAFFDGPAIRHVSGWNHPKAAQSASRVLPEIPTGTNLAHFVHVSDDASSLCVGCLLKSRAVDAAFARGGLGPSISRNLLATISGIEPRYVVSIDGTLLKTLLLNVVVGDKNRPSWCSIHTHEEGEPGPIARLTWRPRLMMPLEASTTDLPCVRCATTDRPRFAHVVMLDSYNHNDSPFGSKNDVDHWKNTAGDPHLLPSDKDAVNLGLNHEEWPLRAMTRILKGSTTSLLDGLPRRSAAIGDSVTISVTSSAGNQAKVDDARHAAVNVPSSLLSRSSQELGAIAAAMSRIFDKSNWKRRGNLIPDEVPRLLDELAVTDEPDAVVEEWLATDKSSIRHPTGFTSSDQPITHGQGDGTNTDDPMWDACKRMVNRLRRLSGRELAALRRSRSNGGRPDAAWQAAFEALWFGLGLPSNSRRHSLREALATVAPIYAANPNRHRSLGPCSLEDRLRHHSSTAQIERVARASPCARDVLLAQLIEAVSGSIDFTDLLLEVSRWYDPIDPTPARWRRLHPDNTDNR